MTAKNQNSENLNIFKANILALFKPKKKETYGLLDKNGLYLLTLLRVELNQLKFYKFQHNFMDTDDPMCSANDGIENNEHYLIDCSRFTQHRVTLVKNVSTLIGTNLLNFAKPKVVEILLCGAKGFNYDINRNILNETAKFIHF